MRVKYTPGPWSQYDYRVFSDDSDVRKFRLIAYTAHNNKERTPEALANARLIAAAPDLVEALEGILELVQVTDYSHSPEMTQRYMKARAALARAVGE